MNKKRLASLIGPAKLIYDLAYSFTRPQCIEPDRQ